MSSSNAILDSNKGADLHFPTTLAWQTTYNDSQSLFDDDSAIFSSQESFGTVQSEWSMDSHNEEVDMHKVAHLFSAGLRLAICDDRKKLGKDIVINKEDLATRLSTIAPSLWCPDFQHVSIGSRSSS